MLFLVDGCSKRNISLGSDKPQKVSIKCLLICGFTQNIKWGDLLLQDFLSVQNNGIRPMMNEVTVL